MKHLNEIRYGKIVAERIQSRRKEMGLKQADLAKKLNRHLNAISSIETNKSALTFAQAVEIAKALDCSLDWLAGARAKKEQPEDPFKDLPPMQRRVMQGLNALSWKDQKEVLNYVRYVAYKANQREIERNERNGEPYAAQNKDK